MLLGNFKPEKGVFLVTFYQKRGLQSQVLDFKEDYAHLLPSPLF